MKIWALSLQQNPAPVVQYEQFSSSSIDVKVFFWTKHLRDSYATRSDLIVAITMAFRENKITIPFPQQNVYLYNLETAADNEELPNTSRKNRIKNKQIP